MKKLTDQEKILHMDIIKSKVQEYVDVHIGKDLPIFDPIFRKENGEYYLGFLVGEFVSPENNDYRMKRPTKWLLVDIVTGELFKIYDSKDYDYADEKTLSINKIFNNNGNSELYDSSNYVLTSFFDWKKRIVSELQQKFDKNINKNVQDPKILKVNDQMISPNNYVLTNIDSILEGLHTEIIEKLGNKVSELYQDYYNYLLEHIRKEYVITNNIEQNHLTNYINLLKYLWPDFINIINEFDNINYSEKI